MMGDEAEATGAGGDRLRDGEATRWVAPLSDDIPRTKHGLLDSATLDNEWYAGDRPRLARELVGSSSYVLLAPGGAGKTTLLADLKRRESHSVSIDLRMHDKRSLAEAVESISSEAPSGDPGAAGPSTVRAVYIDALDEALQFDPNIGHVLVGLLSQPPVAALLWRVTCRPASWTVDLADGLGAALPSFAELELLPLDLHGVEQMAGSDADLFLAAVRHARLTRLLALPLQARNLVRQWRESGRLPASRSEAMRHTVAGMLTEASTSRLPGQLDDQLRQLVAERLAAVSMFCGVARFALGPVVAQGDASVLAVSSVPTRTEPDLAGSSLTVADVREMLDTPLFAASGQGTVAFVHQSYAEFLAAAYLARRGVSGRRLISLLGADVNGLTPGPMLEVLGWLLAVGASLPAGPPTGLIAANAKPLLSTAGLELANDQVRERVVAGLLRGAANGSIDEGWRVDTSVLAHARLGDQLHNAALRATNLWEIFWICRIARQCAVVEAADDLLEMAFDSAWPATMRAEAVNGFAEIGPQDRMGELDDLLDLSFEEDPHDEILAATLKAVLPDAVDFSRISRALRPRRTDNFIGGYHQLLGELPSLLRPDDVLPALSDALRRRPERGDHAFDRLVGGLLKRAWSMRDPVVVRTIGAALGSERISRQAAFRDLPWWEEDDIDLRRAMAAAALAEGEHAFMAVLDLRLLTPRDLGWLIDWMPHAPSEAIKPAQITLRQLAWSVNDAASADRLLDTVKGHPAHEVLAEFHGHRDISSRPDWLDNRAEGEEEATAEQLESVLRDAIARARLDSDDWWRAVVALAGDWPRMGTQVLFGWDLTDRPMWPTLTPDEQEEFLRLGLACLASRRPKVDRWLGRDQWTTADTLPDWSVAYLLGTLAAHRLDLLADVEPDAWATWAETITVMPAFTGGEDWQRRIRDTASQAGRDAIDEACRTHISRDAGTSFAHHPLADFSDPALLDAVKQVALNVEQPKARRDEAIRVLIEHAPVAALHVARTVIADEDAPTPVFLGVLAKLVPDELVSTWIEQDRLGALENLTDLDPELLSDASLAALTRMLIDALPFATDPPRSDDFIRRTPESTARQLRMSLLQTMAGRGMAAHLAALSRYRPAPDLDQIRHLLQEARAREALASWRPLEPKTLMDLLERGDARLVRDGAGLLTVLIEQLGHIQDDIAQRSGFRSLWDGEPGTKGAAPKVEDTISDWLADQLRLRLTPHVVVDREIQVTRRHASGVGTRIDLTVTSGGAPLGRVVIEAKHCHNPTLLKALEDQLLDQYMQPAEIAHAIYIVYWVAREQRPSKWSRAHPDPAALATTLRSQAQRHGPERRIEVFIMDIGKPI